MNESARKVIALVLFIVCAAGAFASMDVAAQHGGYWTYNSFAMGILAAIFLAIALMDGASGGSRMNHVHNEIHVHGQGFLKNSSETYAPQPVMQQQQQPHVVYVQGPPQYVVIERDQLPHQLEGLTVPHGYSMRPLTVAPDGRYIAAPQHEGQPLLQAPQHQRERRSLIRRLIS